MPKEHMIFKVSASNNVVVTADAIVKTLQENKTIEVQAVGAGAVNQAVKSIAAARGKLASSGVDLYMAPGFLTMDTPNGEKTVIIMRLKEF